MKKLYKAKHLLIIASLMLCVIIGLIAALFFQTRNARNIKDSLYEIHSIELDVSIENLKNHIKSDDMVKSYHYALAVADHAAKCGERNTALLMYKMAEEILEEGITPELIYKVADISGGENLNRSSSVEKTIEKASEYLLPSFVSAARYNYAEKAANYLLGGEGVIRSGKQNGAGKLIFSSDNAYALIDEKTSLPIEAAVSSNKASNASRSIDTDVAAKNFLVRVFSKNAAAGAILEEKIIDKEKFCVDYMYSLGRRQVHLSVREDNGKIVRYFITDIG